MTARLEPVRSADAALVAALAAVSAASCCRRARGRRTGQARQGRRSARVRRARSCPADNALNRGYLARAGGSELGGIHRLRSARACTCTPTSAPTRLRHSLHGRRRRISRRVPIHFTEYGAESEPGPYPVPLNAPVEGAGEEGDRHVLVLQEGSCKLYELYSAKRSGTRLGSRLGRGVQPAQQRAAPGRLDLGRRRRPADLPAARALSEVRAGRDRTRAARDRPAHAARLHPPGDAPRLLEQLDPSLPPMGLRLRLKASFDLARLPRPGARHPASAEALRPDRRRQRLAVVHHRRPDPRWNDEDLDQLKSVPGSAFEASARGPILHKG